MKNILGQIASDVAKAGAVRVLISQELSLLISKEHLPTATTVQTVEERGWHRREKPELQKLAAKHFDVYLCTTEESPAPQNSGPENAQKQPRLDTGRNDKLKARLTIVSVEKRLLTKDEKRAKETLENINNLLRKTEPRRIYTITTTE